MAQAGETKKGAPERWSGWSPVCGPRRSCDGRCERCVVVEGPPGAAEAVLLVGSLTDGFEAVGPFARAEDAWRAAERLPFAVALPLQAPPDAAAGEPRAVVLVGNPSDGWRVWGPYRDFEAATFSRAGQEFGSWVLELAGADQGRAAAIPAA
jgi:hypothetical protein